MLIFFHSRAKKSQHFVVEIVEIVFYASTSFFWSKNWDFENSFIFQWVTNSWFEVSVISLKIELEICQIFILVSLSKLSKREEVIEGWNNCSMCRWEPSPVQKSSKCGLLLREIYADVNSSRYFINWLARLRTAREMRGRLGGWITNSTRRYYCFYLYFVLRNWKELLKLLSTYLARFTAFY